MENMIIAIVMLILLLLPIIFRDRIGKLAYTCIGVAMTSFVCSHYKIVEPARGIGQMLLAIVIMVIVVALYTNGYFLFRNKKVS